MLRVAAVVAATLGIALLTIAGLAVLEAATLDLGPIAGRTPFPTALARAREAEARRRGTPYRPDQRTVPLEWISPLLREAVRVAEDDAFFRHGGLDWGEIRSATRRNLERGRVVRGASTITQQLARNLYLGEERTLTRKLKEIVLAIRLERALSKRRILEHYLNVIEWGDGIFGAEAAAERYFGVPADAVDPRQAVLLAAVIINPRRYSPIAPSRRIDRRVRIIAGRLLRRGALSEEQYREVVGAPAEWPESPPGWTPWAAPPDGEGRGGPTEPRAAPGIPPDSAGPDSARADSDSASAESLPDES